MKLRDIVKDKQQILNTDKLKQSKAFDKIADELIAKAKERHGENITPSGNRKSLKDSITYSFGKIHLWYNDEDKSTHIVSKDIKEINEALEYVKFHYSNWHNDKRPRVKALDFKYPGQEGQDTYGQRDDILGWNINYFKNKKYAKKAIDEIDSFARLLAANKLEKYKRIKHFFPEQAKYIRRYMRKHVKGLKRKDNGLWRKTKFPDLVKLNKERF